jgi:twinfilin-like protein
MPEDSTVRDRMVYSSSSAALRDGLGSSNFTSQTWNISQKTECSAKEYEDSQKTMNNSDILTWDEQQKLEAETSSHLAMSSVKVSAIVGLPIKASDDAIAAIKSMNEGKLSAIIFYLHSESEILLVDSSGNYTFEDIAKKFPASEPRYSLSFFQHEHEGKQASSYVFLYYCPDDIKPKLKMFYSTCKSVVIKLCEQLGCEVNKSIECSERNEINTQAVLTDLYPPVSVKKTFAKPTRPGKGKARLHGAD